VQYITAKWGELIGGKHVNVYLYNLKNEITNETRNRSENSEFKIAFTNILVIIVA
jgi:hypothetical protein